MPALLLQGKVTSYRDKPVKPEALRVGNKNLQPSDSIFAPRLARFPVEVKVIALQRKRPTRR